MITYNLLITFIVLSIHLRLVQKYLLKLNLGKSKHLKTFSSKPITKPITKPIKKTKKKTVKLEKDSITIKGKGKDKTIIVKW